MKKKMVIKFIIKRAREMKNEFFHFRASVDIKRLSTPRLTAKGDEQSESRPQDLPWGLMSFIVGFLILAGILFINNEQVLGQNQATNKEINIYFFWQDGCPYCAKSKEFLPKLESKYPNIKIKAFEISSNNENLKAMQTMEAAYGATSRGVPEFFIGDKYYQGFDSEKIDGLVIEQMVQNCLAKSCPDPSDKTINYVNKLNRQSKFAGPYLAGLIMLIVLVIIIGVTSAIIKNKGQKE